MPYQLEWQSHGVIVRVSGMLDYVNVCDANYDIYNDFRAPDIRLQIWDCRKAEGVSISDAEMARIVAQDQLGAKVVGDCKIAIISQDAGLLERFKDYTEMLDVLNTGLDVMAMEQEELAMRWVMVRSPHAPDVELEAEGSEKITAICAKCHKVRDKSNTWVSIENYLQQIEGSQISHSYCDRCFLEEIRNSEDTPD